MAELESKPLYGVVDLYGMAAKVSITDQSGLPPSLRISRLFNESTHENLTAAISPRSIESQISQVADRLVESICQPPLKFHHVTGPNVCIFNESRCAKRLNANDEFENSLVFTNRCLQLGERFDVKVCRLVERWAGTIEMGVVENRPESSDDVPYSLSSLGAGCWVLSGQTVMRNGVSLTNAYGTLRVADIKIGDAIGVAVQRDGTLHFFINGADQGVAANAIGGEVYGCIDLYGSCCEVSIVEPQDIIYLNHDASERQTTESSLVLNALISGCPIRFHATSHGSNVELSADGLTAKRPESQSEFNCGGVIGSRPLFDGEVFEVRLDVVTDSWFGSIGAGVTTVHPERIHWPPTLTEFKIFAWILSGSSMISDGVAINNDRYAVDLNLLAAGDRLGISRHSDGTVHFYVNGVDKGPACYDIPSNVYPLIDVYGRCMQVSITSGANSRNQALDLTSVLPDAKLANVSSSDGNIENVSVDASALAPPISHNRAVECASPEISIGEIVRPEPSDVPHEFYIMSKGGTLDHGNRMVDRRGGTEAALVVSSYPILAGEIFEVKLEALSGQESSDGRLLRIGLSQCSKVEIESFGEAAEWYRVVEFSRPFWWISGNSVYRNKRLITNNFCPTLENLPVSSTVAIWWDRDGCLRLKIDVYTFGHLDMGIFEPCYVVAELSGRCTMISVTSSCPGHLAIDKHRQNRLKDTQDPEDLPVDPNPLLGQIPDPLPVWDRHTIVGVEYDYDWRFSKICGKNVMLDEHCRVASRCEDTWDHGLLFSEGVLWPNVIYQIRVDKLQPELYAGTLSIGVVFAELPADASSLPADILNLRDPPTCVLSECCILRNRLKIANYALDLNVVREKDVIGLVCRDDGTLQFFLNGVDQGIATDKIAPKARLVLDLFGACQSVSIIAPCKPNAADQTAIARAATSGDCGSEKAAVENIGSSEEGEFANLPWILPKVTCSYALRCLELRQLLLIPDEAFTSESKCYCSACVSPLLCAASLAQKIGWCQYNFRVPQRFQNEDAQVTFAGWIRGFMAVKISSVRQLLDAFGPLSSPESAARIFTSDALASSVQQSQSAAADVGDLTHAKPSPVSTGSRSLLASSGIAETASRSRDHIISSTLAAISSDDVTSPFFLNDRKAQTRLKLKCVLEMRVSPDICTKISVPLLQQNGNNSLARIANQNQSLCDAVWQLKDIRTAALMIESLLICFRQE